MNVNNRKLFANRDARRRLAEMGGIVASMPELLGVAQQYNQGGTIRPTYDTGITPFDIIAQRVPGMTQREQIEAGLPRAGLPRREVLEIMGRVDPNIGPEDFSAMNREARRAAGFSGLGSLNNAYFAARDRLLESQFPMQGPPMPPEPEAPRRTLAPEEYINPVDEFAGLPPEMTDPFQLPEVVFDVEEEPPVLSAEPEQGDATGFDLFPTEEPRPISEVTSENTAPVLGTEAAPAANDKEPPPSGAGQTVVQATQNAINNNPNDPSGAAAAAALRGLTGSAADTVQGRVAQYEQLFQEMFGESDEDKARERYMNLAMIGFAIASGEDPSALKNIASGLLQGTQQMREDAAVRRQREDRIKELAVAAGLEDERLARRLAASGGAGGTRFSPTEPFVDAVAAMAQAALQRGEYATIEEAMSAADATLRPYYFPPDLEGMQAAEDAARAAGQTEFSFGGMRYPVR